MALEGVVPTWVGTASPGKCFCTVAMTLSADWFLTGAKLPEHIHLKPEVMLMAEKCILTMLQELHGESLLIIYGLEMLILKLTQKNHQILLG